MNLFCGLKMDEYQRKAQFYPCLWTMIPLAYWLESVLQYEASLEIITIRIIAGLGIYGALIFGLQEVSRSIGKLIFQFPIFAEDEMNMPTTKLLLRSTSDFSLMMLENIVEKIHKEFNLNIDINDVSLENKRVIVDAVRRIRKRTRKDVRLLGYNISYGFRRNMIGGATLGLLVIAVSVGILCLLNYPLDMRNILGCCAVEGGLILFGAITIWHEAKSYAHNLFTVFLG